MERWPQDGRRYELYDGEVFEIPSPLLIHQFVLGRLYLALSEYVRAHGGAVYVAPLDIVCTMFDVVQPDLVYFSPERAHVLQMQKSGQPPPDLAIEIPSDATVRNDRGRKMRLLARHGVREFWIVDPESAVIEVHALEGGRFTRAYVANAGVPIRSTLLADLALDPAELRPVTQH